MIGCIIQARIGSTRLPRKILKELDVKSTVLDYVIEQTSTSKKIEKIIVATTNLKQDEIIADFCNKKGVSFFRGSDNDVLDRYYQCAKKYSFDTIVRITSDNPLVDPEIIDLAIEKFETGNYDMVTTCHVRSFPYGISVEVFSFQALKECWKNAKMQSEREHVITYMHNKNQNFKIFNLINEENLTYINCTVDNESDYKLVKKVIHEIKDRPILMKHIVTLFKQKPELLKINKDSDPYAGYKKSLKEDKLIN